MAINWNLDNDGVLTIWGEGRMPDYACGGRAAAPWSDVRDQIRTVSIQEGITEIGMRAFEYCGNLQSVFLPGSVIRIHSRAFFDCKNLTQVHTAVKNTKFAYIFSPGWEAWYEATRPEEPEQTDTAKGKKSKEQNSEEHNEKDGQGSEKHGGENGQNRQGSEGKNGGKEKDAKGQSETYGQAVLEVRRDKSGQVILEIRRDKNGQILEWRKGKYGHVVEIRKNQNGQVLEVRKVENGQVFQKKTDRSSSVPEEGENAGSRAVKEQEFAAGDMILRRTRRKRYLENPEIRFGIGSFYNVPWAGKKWNDFYVADGVLYTCLSGKKELTIPKGVHTLEKFAFKDTEAESILLPQSLETIRAFAFAESRVQSLEIPESVTTLEDYAFADSGLTNLVFSGGCRCSVSEGTFYRSSFLYKKCQEGLPELFELKAVQEKKRYGGFRRLRVVRKKGKSAEKTDLSKTGSYGALRIDAAKHLLRRMKTGKVILMVHCEQSQIMWVESFLWDREEKMVGAYLMYPCIDENGIAIYRDSFRWQEKEDFMEAFPEEDAVLLEMQGGLRRQEEGMSEEWFWSADRDSFGGKLEPELLEYLCGAQNVHVGTEEECRARLEGTVTSAITEKWR